VEAADLPAVQCDGRTLRAYADDDGAVLVELPHSPGQALPVHIGYIDNPSNEPEPGATHADPAFPGLQAVLHSSSDGLALRVRNGTGDALRNVAVTYRLPLRYSPGVIRRTLPDVLDALDDAVAPQHRSDAYKLAAGQPFFAAQLDFTWRDEPCRLHLASRAAGVGRDPSFPQGGFLVSESLDEADLAALDLLRVAGNAETAGLRWQQEPVELIRALDPEVVATSGGWRAPDDGRRIRLLRSTVQAPTEREVGFLGDARGLRAVYLNGAEVTDGTALLRQGENDLLVVAQGSAGGFSRSNAGCFLRLVRPGTGERLEDLDFRRPD
jgi:hypothetical protein